MAVHYRAGGPVVTITIDRPGVCNAIDRPTAEELAAAMRRFDADPRLSAAVLTGAGGKFYGGADLTAMTDPGSGRVNRVEAHGDGLPTPGTGSPRTPVLASSPAKTRGGQS